MSRTRLNLDVELSTLLEAVALCSAEGQGKPLGSKVVASGSAEEAVVADRDEQEQVTFSALVKVASQAEADD